MSGGLFGGLFRRPQKDDQKKTPDPSTGSGDDRGVPGPPVNGREIGYSGGDRDQKEKNENSPLKYGQKGSSDQQPGSSALPRSQAGRENGYDRDLPPDNGLNAGSRPPRDIGQVELTNRFEASNPSRPVPGNTADIQANTRPVFAAGGSPIDALAHDNVVMSLLQEGVISMPQALIALREQASHPDAALWRILSGLKGIDRDAVFSEAARVLGFATAHLSAKKPTDDLVEAVRGLFPAEIGKEMLSLGLLPYEFVMDPVSKQHRLVFASNDPSDPKLESFVGRLGLEVEIRYAPSTVLNERMRPFVADAARKQSSAETPVARKERFVQPDETKINLPNIESQNRTTEEEYDETAGKMDGPHRPSLSPNGLTFDELTRIINPKESTDSEILVEPHFHAPIDRIGDDRTDGDLDRPTGFSTNEHSNDLESGQPGSPYETHGGGPTDGCLPPDDPDAESTDEEAGTVELNVDTKDRVVAMLLRKEIVTPQQVLEAQKKQLKDKSKEALWRILAHAGGVDREVVFAEAARVYAFPSAKFGEGQPDPEFARSVVETFSEERRDELLRLRVLPFECDLEQQTGAIKLVFITHDPTRPEVHRLMQKLKLERFELRYAPESVVHAAILEAFPRRNEYLERVQAGDMAYDLGTNYDEKAGLVDEDQLEAEISRSKLINLFEATLIEAVRQGASDVHIYPNAERKIEIHFRVDGRLGLWHLEDKVHPEALLAVIKDNSTNVDRFERDAAQDGFIQRWIDDVLIRFRVSVLPIANANQDIRSESIVIRVLDDRKVITDLKKLGLLPNAQQRFESAIRQPHGMVILTGPTGSGKSTTLVAALHQVVTPEVNVLTVEDPVEYIIPGVRQIKLNYKLGLEEALRAILRHDPDVVMVGEMRDRQTAELAIKLANTGHLTFSTLHTNDATAAVSRLYKMGIEPFLIGYAINLVVAQRLIRKLCPACKVIDDDPDSVMLNKMGFTDDEIASTAIYKQGHDPNCKVCKGMGYKGRRAICEALYFSRAIRHIIVESDKQINEEAIKDQAVKEGMLTLNDSAKEIVKMGETSILEMLRVVTTDS